MEKELRKRVGQNIRAWRMKAGFTLEALAELADLDTGFLTHLEHGDKMAGLLTLAKIAKGLGVPMASLVADATSGKSDLDYAFLQQVRSAVRGKSRGHRRELVGILKGLRDTKTLAAVKQLVGK